MNHPRVNVRIIKEFVGNSIVHNGLIGCFEFTKEGFLKDGSPIGKVWLRQSPDESIARIMNVRSLFKLGSIVIPKLRGTVNIAIVGGTQFGISGSLPNRIECHKETFQCWYMDDITTLIGMSGMYQEGKFGPVGKTRIVLDPIVVVLDPGIHGSKEIDVTVHYGTVGE